MSKRPCWHSRAARSTARTRMTAMHAPESGLRYPAELSAQVSVAERAQPSDERFVCAYPHFNVNGACTSRQDVCMSSMELCSNARHVHAHHLRWWAPPVPVCSGGGIDVLFHAGTARTCGACLPWPITGAVSARDARRGGAVGGRSVRQRPARHRLQRWVATRRPA